MHYTLPSLLGLAALAAAHGFVDTAVIGGDTYEFYQPYTDPYTSPVPDRVSRFIAGNGPVRDVTSLDLTCGGEGSGSQPAALHAQAAAGSTIELAWTLWPDSHVGPVLTYMARCPNEGCQDYQPNDDSVWFKVQEGGREGLTNEWAASAVMTEGGTVEYTIPECLASGFYLVRHEIIALHQEAEFYPGCHQLEVTGSGSTVPSSGLVGFPGAYSASDSGIDYSPYQDSVEYVIPGPALFTCGGSGGSEPAPPAATPTSITVPTTSVAVDPVSSSPVAFPTDVLEPIDEDDEDDEEGLVDCPADDEDEDEDADEEDEEDEELEDCPAEDDEDDDEDEDLEEDGDEPTVPTKRQSLHERRTRFY